MPDLGGVAADLGLKVDGLLGGEVLREVRAVVDYPGRLLRLAPPAAADLRAMQGEWYAVGIARSDRDIRPQTRANMHTVRLTVRGDRMRLDGSGTGAGVLDQWIELRPSLRPGRYVSGDVWVDGRKYPGERIGQLGLYDVTADRLRLLMPTDKRVRDEDLPADLTAATPASAMTLYTFARRPPPPLGWLVHLTGLHPRPAPPLRLGGWELTRAGGTAGTATHAASRRRLTLTLDGRLIAEPVRP